MRHGKLILALVMIVVAGTVLWYMTRGKEKSAAPVLEHTQDPATVWDEAPADTAAVDTVGAVID